MDLAGCVGGATASNNSVSFGKNHLLVVSSNKVIPKFYFLISIYLLKSIVAGGGGGGGGGEETYFKLISRRPSSIPSQNVQQFSLVSGFV